MHGSYDRSGIVTRIGMASFRNRRLVLVAWPMLLAVLLAIASVVGGDFRQSFALPGSETQRTVDRLEGAGLEGFGGQEGQVVVHAPDVTSPRILGPLAGYLEEVGARVHGVVVRGPFGDHGWGGGGISADGTVAYASVSFGDVSFSDAQQRATNVVQLADEHLVLPPDAVVEFAGDMFAAESEFSSEGLGLIAAAIILLFAFGSLLAMGLPIVSALLGIGCGTAIVVMATRWIDIPPFAPATVGMIGIGVGVDYALFNVTRYREELHVGADPEQATSVAMATAGRSTVFAGATVVTSLLGLLVIGLDDIRSLALAAGAGVGFVMLSSVTLLPALLGFVGHNIDRFGLPHRRNVDAGDVEESVWYRWSRVLQRRPGAVSVLALAVLLVLAAPTASLRLGLTDASSRPQSDTTRRAHDLLVGAFGPGSAAPLIVAVSLPDGAGEDPVEELSAAIEGDGGVASVSPPILTEDQATAALAVEPTTGLQERETVELVHRLRGQVLPATLEGTGANALIGGPAAAAVDFAAHSRRTLPWFIGVVLALSFVVLTVLFRSILVPLKAVAVNLISVGAAYGVVVAVFQWGWLDGMLPVGAPGPIEAWVPMMLFAIVFGLSIDYEVFLLSRIRERYEQTRDNALSVADGLARTARLIAAAAAIMVCVFGAFVLSAERSLQMLGLGLAVAIAVDATLVRLVLVPATMELLGDRNWWLPPWLDRILPDPAVRHGRERPTVRIAP